MRTHAGRLLAPLCLVASGLAVTAALRAAVSSSAEAAGGALAVEASPVPLDPTDPSRESVGPLRYLGGLWLRSADARFGGLSDLRVSADGSRLLAVSDCGSGFTATLSYDSAGRLAGLGEPRLVPLAGPAGAPALGESDAESLVVGDAGLEVGFEGRARVQAYAADPAFAGPSRPLPFPATRVVGQCGRNGGLEAMSDLGGGRRFLACETRRGASSSVPAWIGSGEDWTEREYPLVFEGGWAGEPFRPTGAALLPDGDLLVVERRFPPLGARIVRLARAGLDGRGALRPAEVARLEPPLQVDNFEGIAVRTDAAGRLLVYLLSDDNDCAKSPGAGRRGLQKTLLLLFRLEEEA